MNAKKSKLADNLYEDLKHYIEGYKDFNRLTIDDISITLVKLAYWYFVSN